MEGKTFGGTNLGGGLKVLKLSKNFQQLSHSQHFGVGVKIHQVLLKRSMVISADSFTVLLRYF